jgi:hypothetical protein
VRLHVPFYPRYPYLLMAPAEGTGVASAYKGSRRRLYGLSVPYTRTPIIASAYRRWAFLGYRAQDLLKPHGYPLPSVDPSRYCSNAFRAKVKEVPSKTLTTT